MRAEKVMTEADHINSALLVNDFFHFFTIDADHNT